MIENDLTRRNDREDVLPILSVFYINLQYCLSVSVPVNVLSVPTIGPLGTGSDYFFLSTLDFWALMLKPK